MRGQWLGLHVLSFFSDWLSICVHVPCLLFSAIFRASWYFLMYMPNPRVSVCTASILRVLLSVNGVLSHTIGAHQLD